MTRREETSEESIVAVLTDGTLRRCHDIELTAVRASDGQEIVAVVAECRGCFVFWRGERTDLVHRLEFRERFVEFVAMHRHGASS